MIWLASTVTVVVLLFGYHTSTNTATSSTGVSAPAVPVDPAPTASSSSSSRSRAASSTSASASPSSAPSTSASTAAKSYTGTVAQTRWGPVEVEIAVTSGKITKVTVLQSPSGNPRDTEINDQALPVLVQSTLQAQSAKIDMVSGATVTSGGYLQSLQSALDQAGI